MIRDSLHSLFWNAVSKISLANRTILQGDWRLEKTICISFDCDYESDMLNLGNLLPLLERSEISTSFAIPGTLVKRFPETVEVLIKQGHEILNHTLTHPDGFRNLPVGEKMKEIKGFQQLMLDLFNYVPKGFRCPHLLRQYQEELFGAIGENNLRYDSSLLGKGVSRVGDIIEVPLNPCPRHSKRAFDSYHHFYPGVLSASVKAFIEDFKQLVQELDLVNIYLDPRDLVDRIPTEAFEEMIRYAKESGFRFSTLNMICVNI